MVKPLVRIGDRGVDPDGLPVLATGIARDQQPDHLFDILIRPAQPVLHRQKPVAQVLAFARDQTQDLGQAAERLHLTFAGLAFLGTAGAQLFQQSHRAAGRFGHVQLAHLGQFDDVAVGNDVDHRIAGIAARDQVRHDRGGMFLQKQQVRDDDIRRGDGLLGIGEGCGVLAPFGRGVDRDFQPRKIGDQPVADTDGRACGVTVKGDNHEAESIYVGVIAHNVLSPHKGCREKFRPVRVLLRTPRYSGGPCPVRRTESFSIRVRHR